MPSSLSQSKRQFTRKVKAISKAPPPLISLPLNPVKSKKKRKKVPYRENTSHLSYEHLQKSLLKAIGNDYRFTLNPAMIKLCHAWAKLATPLVPSSLNMVDNQAQRKAILAMLESQRRHALRTSFVEICIFICLLAWQLYELELPPDLDGDKNAKTLDLESAQETAFTSL